MPSPSARALDGAIKPAQATRLSAIHASAEWLPARLLGVLEIADRLGELVSGRRAQHAGALRRLSHSELLVHETEVVIGLGVIRINFKAPLPSNFRLIVTF